TKLEGGNPSESSLVSTPTSTSISFVDTEGGTQVEEDRDQHEDQRRRSSNEEDDDATDARTHAFPIFILPRHRSWESEGRSEEEDDVLIGRRNTTTGTPVQRDESLVASSKYVNGVWDQGELPNGLNNASATKVQPRRRFTDEDEVDPGEETQDEVVYKGS
ncbi:hypothetical protein FRC02_001371, partial [Tulasnella sp. 418]